ncbi:RNA polymerase subunit sigma-24 [Sorangium cellulosum]|uniref:RNA polymerase subunit sigma-24 n=1 Tax=Sorangium cellulosum TaxID=56 RepID=A0A2L0FA53_SORCE|nr:sigma-70 family RNA polymerase sigma factor [Sorangium cellulosum]AUX48468.1 RNA polymerase subunit sigma-24 [Sorangium cellulosum]
MTTPRLVEHFFRHEYGRLVAMLSRRVGVRQIEAVEDAVQSALMTALESWTIAGLPDNPSAWLFRVAHNALVGELRRRARRDRMLEQHALEDIGAPENGPEPSLAGDVRDDLLRMLFVCCDDAIPVESQLVLALKTLCGFDVREIADRLFTSEASVYKRLGRARSRLRELPPRRDELTEEQYSSRLPAVHAILYLLFTEGHLSSHAETAIRRELCDEAMRLAAMLAEHPLGRAPETFALVALMHLHAARMTARQDGSGGLLLLEEQDRGLWDQREIQVGLSWLAKSAHGNVFSRYHAEAGIAAEHCLAPSLAETRWDRVVECYALLERLGPSAIHTLNRAVAVAEWQGPAAGLAVLDGLEPPTWLAGSYLWAAVLADLHRRCGNDGAALRYRDVAIRAAPTPAVQELLQRRLRTGGQ